ncbi:MAG: hypothetical protein K9K64_05765 [Desulfohalobiaceae bacterium]|nr:hypothetical protein [Desulfohalobiaceae bacterium]
MLRKKILVLYNFSRQDERVLSYLVENYLGRESVRITLLHVYTALQKYTQLRRGAGEGPSFKGAGQKTGLRINEFRKKEDELQRIGHYLQDEGFLSGQIEPRFTPKVNSLAQDMVDIVRKEAFTTVLLSYVPVKAKYFLAERIEDKLLNKLKDTEIIFLT